MKRRLLAFVFSSVSILAVAPALAQTAPGASDAPTFSKDVAPILYAHCVECHRAGEIGPMSLVTYPEARPYARAIATRVANGTMPPWHADPAHGEFANDRRLSAREKDIIARWTASGAPEGSPADLPPAPTFVSGWNIKPDATFSMLEDYPVPASGTVEYKYFEVPTNFTEDRWIQSIEVRPGSRSTVHHVIVFARSPKQPQQQRTSAPGKAPFTFASNMGEDVDPDDSPAKKAPLNDRPMPAAGFDAMLGGFVPGQSITRFQPGTAVRLRAGTTLIFQMHYTASGKSATDRTTIGFEFAKEKPQHEVIVAALQNHNFTIPAGASDARIDADMTFNMDSTLYNLTPHTHVRGKAWELSVVYPDGRSETVLSVPKYDFNWQTTYFFKTPLKLPAGTRLHTTAWYDNSASNKANPDPNVDVTWGDQTWQEMQFTAFAFSIDAADARPSSGQHQ